VSSPSPSAAKGRGRVGKKGKRRGKKKKKKKKEEGKKRGAHRHVGWHAQRFACHSPLGPPLSLTWLS
jgi:hypothetical protein